VSVEAAGTAFRNAGTTLAEALSQVPVIGEGAGNLVRGAFEGIGSPLVQAGTDLERLLLIIAALLGLLVAAVALIPWLNRYLPWRRNRWQRLRAGDQAINRGHAVRVGTIPDAELQRVLASRAMNRLEYADLLDHTPDPIGDFVAGRFDRLAAAELADSGLMPKAPSSGG
jgi:hypothetical protein